MVCFDLFFSLDCSIGVDSLMFKIADSCDSKTMTQLMLRCRNCGSEFLSLIQMDEESFHSAILSNESEPCPNCTQTFAHNKLDYFFK